jgi:2'-5' RNA ligase
MNRRAIVLLVPPPGRDALDEIRMRWDPVMCARIGAHITLVHDVVDHDRADERLAAAAATTAPFRIRLTRSDRWRSSASGIYLHVEDPTGAVAALHARFADLEHPAWARAPFRAHCTLVHARTVDAAVANEAWSVLEGFDAALDVDVDAIDLIELVEPAWRAVERFELRAAALAD